MAPRVGIRLAARVSRGRGATSLRRRGQWRYPISTDRNWGCGSALPAIVPAPLDSAKRTLCAALVGKGWRLLSDELALVRLDTGELVPLPRPISLKNASINIIRR